MTKVPQIFDIEGAETRRGVEDGQLRHCRTCTSRGIVQVGCNDRELGISRTGRLL